MLVEWHIPPETVNETWTEEMLQLMFDKRNERLTATSGDKKDSKLPRQERTKHMRDRDLFAMMNIPIDTVKQ